MRRIMMREVILHLPDVMYERLAKEAAAVHKPVEQWIIDILTADVGSLAHTAESHEMLAAALEALGFQRLEPGKASRLSALLKVRQERPLSDDETAELKDLMAAANALELASLQRLAATLGR
jgi:plasmid stability protein